MKALFHVVRPLTFALDPIVIGGQWRGRGAPSGKIVTPNQDCFGPLSDTTMKYRLTYILLVSVCCLPAPNDLVAQAPELMSFQGLLTNTEGTPIDSPQDLVFSIYDSAGSQVWTETQLGVDVSHGLFDVQLGSIESLDVLAFDHSMKLGVKIGSDAEISPRTDLLTAPYAFSLRHLRVYPNTAPPDNGPTLIGGHNSNSFDPGTHGVTIAGGGAGSGWNLNNIEFDCSGAKPSNQANWVGGDYGTISGGFYNVACTVGTVAGGRENRAINGYAAVGGGKNNQAGGQQSVVGGGEGNMAGGYHAAVGGGQENVADGDASTVGGGALNEATALGATVSGGRFNTAGGRDATVPGGADNVASGYYSLAAGRRARAEHGGTFVWADSASVGGTDFVSTGSDQFLIRAGGGVGIGTNAPITQFHVVRNISAAATTANHVALIDNSSTGAGADVLALRIARTTEPQTTNAFITFKYGESTSAGFIRGNGTGGVELISETADYAEYLPHLNIGEQLEPGDVVGVFAGKISRGTGGADRIMVISTAPIVVGNHKARGEGDEIGYSRVAFLGQAPVKVTGPVRSGEFLIPSGRGDGTARSVHPADLRVDQIRSVIGTAWDSNDAPGTVRVNAAIGIDQITVAARAIEALHAREKRREEEIASHPRPAGCVGGEDDELERPESGVRGPASVICILPNATQTELWNARPNSHHQIQGRPTMNNEVQGLDATVGGGFDNTARGSRATVGGGRQNEAGGDETTVAGGSVNTAGANRATVGGGD